MEEIFEKHRDSIYLNLFKVLNLTTASLLDPCYNPPVASLLKKNFQLGLFRDILSSDNFNFSKYIKDKIYKQIATYRLYRDEMVWFLILTSLYFNNKKKQDSLDADIVFLSSFILLLKYYTSLSNKHMTKFCDKTKSILALETLSDKSLFSTKNKQVQMRAKSILNQISLSSKLKKNIANSPIALGMIHILDVVINKYYSKIKLNDYKTIAKLIIIYRHRMSQSFKAYARHYYELIGMRNEIYEDENVSILNAVNMVVNKNTQKMVYIPDTQYKLLMQTTSVSVDILKDIYKTLYDNADHNQSLNKMITIMLSDGRYEKLIESSSAFEWMTIIRGVIAIRSKYDIRKMLLSIVESDEKLSKIYESKSDSYKHKILQAVGGVIGISIYSTIKSYNIKSISLGMIV